MFHRRATLKKKRRHRASFIGHPVTAANWAAHNAGDVSAYSQSSGFHVIVVMPIRSAASRGLPYDRAVFFFNVADTFRSELKPCVWPKCRPKRHVKIGSRRRALVGHSSSVSIPRSYDAIE